MHRRWTRAATITALVSLAGCSPSPGPAASEDSPTPAPPAASPATPSPPGPPPAPTPGFEHGARLYLAIGDHVRRLDATGSALLPGATDGEILDMFEGRDAKLYVRDRAALYVLEGDALVERIRFAPEILPVHHLALDHDQQAWIVSDAGIGMVAPDGGWSLTPLAELELDSSAQLGFDHEGAAWVAMPGRALYREQQRWIATEVAWLGEHTGFRNAQGSPVGRVHVSNHHLLTRLGKGDFDSVVIDPKLALDYSADLDIAPDGYACVATRECAIACANAVPPTIIWRFAANHFSCTQVEAIAVDAKHRVWVASTTHLSLLDPQDRQQPAHEWVRSDEPALSGSVRQLVVIDGP